MSKERRRYYRIEDSVLLQARVVKADELENKLEDFKLSRQQFSIHNSFNHNIERQIADLQTIEDKIPELARYLSGLQRQIDRLTEAVLPDQTSLQQEQQNVNLSAQGIAFFTDGEFKPVDVVELKLQLMPSAHQLLIYSRVVLVEDNKDDTEAGKFRVSLDFEHIHDADREILFKHIHNRQLLELGTNRHAAL